MDRMDECALYADPELYDCLFPSAGSGSVEDEVRRARFLTSERFYVEEARRGGGPVLELGCGSGRLTIPIARAGIEIVGADLSRPMLEAARAKARAAGVEVDLREADMRGFDMPERFSAILIAGNSLLHLLTLDELKECLASVRRHLAPGGRFVFDISKWDLSRLARDPSQRYPVYTLNDPKRGEIAIEETASYDTARQIRRIGWYLSAPGAPDFRIVEYELRVIFPQELVLLLEIAGFKLEARYGEFTREPFDSNSPRQVVICSV
jgi:SAM-dependent methyltransferase